MKDSLHIRLFFSFILLSSLFTGTSWIANSLFSRSFYLYSKKQTLHKIALEIDALYDGSEFIDKLAIERIEYEKNVHIAIFDKNYKAVYDSLFPSPPQTPEDWDNRDNQSGMFMPPPQPPWNWDNRDNQSGMFIPPADWKNRKDDSDHFPQPPMLPPNFSGISNSWNSKINYELDSQYIIYERRDRRLNVFYLEYICKLKTEHILRMFVSITPIEESANVANSLSLMTGLFTLLIGGILSIVYAKWFSGSIIELKTIAEYMTRLDFSRKYTGKRRDEVGELGRSINILSDHLQHFISSLEAANTKLMADIEKGRELEVMRKNFISSVSHELKTPLALVQGYAEGLRSEIVRSSGKRDEYCSIIIDETMKMDRLIKDLLDLALLDSGTFSIQYQPVNIYQLTESIIKKFKPIFDQRGVNFSFSIDYKDTVYADPMRIEQVFVNFITNALYHVDKSGIVKIMITNQGKFIRIAVYNSGKQIPRHELENIWISFYKMDKARTREYGGTGLGLSIVRSIMNLHKTAYGVVNRQKGVEFWFNLRKEKSSAS